MRAGGAIAALLALLAGCAEKAEEPAVKMLQVTSSAFQNGAAIPTKYTGEGQDVSPPLAWTGAPAGTREFAIIMDDPDAPGAEPWVHWVLYAIPANVSTLAEAGTAGGVEGVNSWKRAGYGGPMPPIGHGAHHYHFKVYALDLQLALPAAASKAQLLKAMQGRVLAFGELVGTYER